MADDRTTWELFFQSQGIPDITQKLENLNLQLRQSNETLSMGTSGGEVLAAGGLPTVSSPLNLHAKRPFTVYLIPLPVRFSVWNFTEDRWRVSGWIEIIPANSADKQSLTCLFVPNQKPAGNVTCAAQLTVSDAFSPTTAPRMLTFCHCEVLLELG